MYNSSLAPSVVKTALDEVFFGKFSYENTPGLATAQTEAIFKKISVDRGAYITEQFMGPGYFESRDEMQDVPQATSRVGNQKTFSIINYAKSIDISKNLMDDDQHETINELVRRLARNAKMTQDKNAFDVLNKGFTTTTTNDGVALFSNSHATLNGDTVDNLETGTLTEANLDVMFQSLVNQRTQDGTLGGHVAATLLVPPALFKTATEITKSTLRSGTPNNDLNYFSEVYPGLMVYQSPFLGSAQGGSNTAYFLLSDNHSLRRFVRQDTSTDLVDYKTQRNNNYIYKAEYREVTGPISFEGIVGSNGTT